MKGKIFEENQRALCSALSYTVECKFILINLEAKQKLYFNVEVKSCGKFTCCQGKDNIMSPCIAQTWDVHMFLGISLVMYWSCNACEWYTKEYPMNHSIH